MPLTKKTGERASGSAIVPASGVADVVLNGPPRGYIDISTIDVTCTPGVPIPTCDVYDGAAAALGRHYAAVRAGDKGTFRGTNDRLNAGSQITVRWTGAPVGAVVRAILRGDELS